MTRTHTYALFRTQGAAYVQSLSARRIFKQYTPNIFSYPSSAEAAVGALRRPLLNDSPSRGETTNLCTGEGGRRESVWGETRG